MRAQSILWSCSAALVLMSASCASQDYVIPESLAGQIDRSLTFEQLKESAASYVGKVVVLGGEVLTAKRLPEGTSIEILQLPLDGSEPVTEAQQSQGRFLAVQKEFLDPATLDARPRVTVVGEVTGVRTQRLDDVEYTYPVLAIKDLKVWPDPIGYGPRAGPRFGVSIGGGTGIGVGVGGGVGIGF